MSENFVVQKPLHTQLAQPSGNYLIFPTYMWIQSVHKQQPSSLTFSHVPRITSNNLDLFLSFCVGYPPPTTKAIGPLICLEFIWQWPLNVDPFDAVFYWNKDASEVWWFSFICCNQVFSLFVFQKTKSMELLVFYSKAFILVFKSCWSSLIYSLQLFRVLSLRKCRH